MTTPKPLKMVKRTMVMVRMVMAWNMKMMVLDELGSISFSWQSQIVWIHYNDNVGS